MLSIYSNLKDFYLLNLIRLETYKDFYISLLKCQLIRETFPDQAI